MVKFLNTYKYKTHTPINKGLGLNILTNNNHTPIIKCLHECFYYVFNTILTIILKNSYRYMKKIIFLINTRLHFNFL